MEEGAEGADDNLLVPVVERYSVAMGGLAATTVSLSNVSQAAKGQPLNDTTLAELQKITQVRRGVEEAGRGVWGGRGGVGS